MERSYISCDGFISWANENNWLRIIHSHLERSVSEDIYITPTGQEVLVRSEDNEITEITTRTCILEA